MFFASEKRKSNIAEYLIYMWQIEDIIRANDLNLDKIKQNVISKYTNLTDDQRRELAEWYESLIDMMRREGIEKSGHLQINKNTLMQMVEIHQALLKDPRFPEYSAQFYKTLPYIVELRSKAGDKATGEIETCFTALYGMLMLRLQSKEVSPETVAAVNQISSFIALLAKHFHVDKEEIEKGMAD